MDEVVEENSTLGLADVLDPDSDAIDSDGGLQVSSTPSTAIVSPNRLRCPPAAEPKTASRWESSAPDAGDAGTAFDFAGRCQHDRCSAQLVPRTQSCAITLRPERC